MLSVVRAGRVAWKEKTTLQIVLFSLNLRGFQFFPAPPKIQCCQHSLVIILKMCKKTNLQTPNKRRHHTKPRQPAVTVRKEQNYEIPPIHNNPFQDLQQNPVEADQSNPEKLLEAARQHSLSFFNSVRTVPVEELRIEVHRMANLLTLLAPNAELPLMNQAKIKLKRFQTEGGSLSVLLFILASLIFRERTTTEKHIADLNAAIYRDASFVKSLLLTKITGGRRMGKYYGIVMLHLSGCKLSMRLREAMLSGILRNFRRIDHQPTLFNLLVHLRQQKYKVKLNFSDVQEGSIINCLLAAYPHYIEHYQSYPILDYLLHLVQLFPPINSVIPRSFFTFVVSHTQPWHMHHPLHANAVLAIVECAMNGQDRDLTAKAVMEGISDGRMIGKIGNLIIQDLSVQSLLEMAHSNTFEQLILKIKPSVQTSTVEQISTFFTSLTTKLSSYSSTTSSYLMYLLKTRLSFNSQ